MPITITVRKNGSLGINAEDAAQIVLVDSEGNVIPPRAEGRPMSLCRCGHSAIKPFCDGAHKGSGLTPLKFHAEQSKTLYFCGCKHSQTPPLCDGSHQQL